MSSLAIGRVYSERRFLAFAAVVAFLVRLVPVLTGGGLAFYGRYDDSVYYSAADSLTFGRLPYKDFTLLHPPLLMLVLTPFAALGRVTTDATGLSVARLAFMGVGALNTVLVALIARRWGRRAAVVAALMYATWLPAVFSEQTTMLEPLGTTAWCVAILLLLRTDRPPTRLEEVFAGVALGLGVTEKIWYAAPFAAVLAWQLAGRRFRSAAWIAGAGVGAAAVVLLPFAILTRGRMWDMVVRDQLTRSHVVVSPFRRLTSILGLQAFDPHQYRYLDVLTVLGLVVLVVACLACARDRRGRILVWFFVVNLGVLMQTPPYYEHYAAFTAPPATLVAAVAASKLTRLPRIPMRAGFVTAMVLVAVSAVAVMAKSVGHPFPGDLGALAPAGCTTSDTPEALIDMNRLSRDLGQNCPVPVDVTGITYDRLAAPTRRVFNLPWQHYLVGYLLSGSSFVVARPRDDDATFATQRALARRPAIATLDNLWLRRGFGSE